MRRPLRLESGAKLNTTGVVTIANGQYTEGHMYVSGAGTTVSVGGGDLVTATNTGYRTGSLTATDSATVTGTIRAG